LRGPSRLHSARAAGTEVVGYVGVHHSRDRDTVDSVGTGPEYLRELLLASGET